MQSFFDRFDVAAKGRNGATSEVAADECCPLLSEAMLGQFDPQTGYCLVPAMKVTIFRDGDHLKAVVGCGPAFKRFFLTLSGLEAACEQVEQALAEGRGEWVAPKVRKPNLTGQVK